MLHHIYYPILIYLLQGGKVYTVEWLIVNMLGI